MVSVEGSTEFCRQQLIALWDEWRARGGNQSTLATACGVAQGQISLWLKDLKAGVVPRVQSLEVLCRGYGVTLASLFPPAAPTAAHAYLFALAARLDEKKAADFAAEVRAYLEGRGISLEGVHEPVESAKKAR